jgi:hypothetical protein
VIGSAFGGMGSFEQAALDLDKVSILIKILNLTFE